MRRVASRTFSVSLMGVLVAAGLCAVAIARAVTVEPVEPAALGVASSAELSRAEVPAARVPSEGVLGTDALALAVDRDPFMPDRQRAEAYRLPDERFTGRVEARDEEPVEPPPFRIIGTASAGSRSMALVQPLESAEIDMVIVGRDFQGYRLDSVDDESATLIMRDRTFRLGIQEGLPAGPATRLAGMPVETWQRMLATLRGRGMSEEAIARILDANLNLGIADGPQFQFNAGWTGLPPQFEVRVSEVPAEPEPRRRPFGRAGRGGRMSADTMSYEPR
jgi:hypothetical protein